MIQRHRPILLQKFRNIWQEALFEAVKKLVQISLAETDKAS